MKITETEALLYAIKQLSRADNTSFQIRKKLEQKGFKKEEIKKVIKYLILKDYLNDRRYAANVINKNIESGKKGPKLLYYELRKKGVQKEICKSLINELYTQETEIKAMKKLNLKMTNEKKKLIEKLRRRGFRLSSILMYANSI
jgi:regulatory protein